MKNLSRILVAVALALSASAASAVVSGQLEGPGPNMLVPANVMFRGWAIAPGSPAALDVRVMEGGTLLASGAANRYSQIAAQIFGAANAYHGFELPFTFATTGDHFVTILAKDPVNQMYVPIPPCQGGPIRITVSSIQGAFTAPQHGEPTTTSFWLEGFLKDAADPNATLTATIAWRSDQDAEQRINVAANLPRSDVGNHGFRVHMVLPTNKHWYIQLIADDHGCSRGLTMLNVDTLCPGACAAPSYSVCAGGSVTIGMPAPPLYGEPAIYQWSPATGLSSTTIPNPVASPSSTTTYTLTVRDAANTCLQTRTTTVTVLAASASSSASVSGCAAVGGTASVALSGSSGGTATYAWDFESDGSWDVTGLASAATTHAYAAGVHTATLRASVSTSAGQVCDVTSATSFTVPQCEPPSTGCAPRSVGYWSQQFEGYPAQKEDACTSLDGIAAASPLFWEAIPLAGPDRCAQSEDILNTGGGSMWNRALRQLLGLRLNLASDKISASAGVSLPYSTSTTVAAAIAECEAILLNPSSSSSELERAKDIAEALDLGCGYSPECESGCELELTATKSASGAVSLVWTRSGDSGYLVEIGTGSGTSFASAWETIVVGTNSYTDARFGDLVCYRTSR